MSTAEEGGRVEEASAGQGQSWRDGEGGVKVERSWAAATTGSRGSGEKGHPWRRKGELGRGGGGAASGNLGFFKKKF